MAEIPKNMIEMVNKQGRVGVLCTVDAEGKPNAAYFGSPRFRDDNTLSLGLMGGRTLANLKANPNAVYFCIEESPVAFSTPGCRIYLKVREMVTEGPLMEQIKEEIAKHAGADAAKMMTAAVAFDITETRNLVDMG
ncbi:MAG: pyridoxamine 5'-phosphate oxidase family protein [Proteobacteria bacterium]|nr:pyridoxamine 5'-phosphate oxidase family protein [Pseudomonadota bacterium]